MNEDVKVEDNLDLQTEGDEAPTTPASLNRRDLRREIKRKIDELYHRGKKRVGD